MIRDPDFSKVTFKVNAAGSWANLVTCDAVRIDEVKKACEVIAKGSRIKFKYVDADGGTCEVYGWNGAATCWHEPMGGR
jgi:hypothetical protein